MDGQGLGVMCGSEEGRRGPGQNDEVVITRDVLLKTRGEVRLAGTPMWPVGTFLAIPGLVVRHWQTQNVTSCLTHTLVFWPSCSSKSRL